MFFPERIKSINYSDKVLEIGPGSLPFLRANLYLEKTFDKDDGFEQAGFSNSPESIKHKIIYYEKCPFPFQDNEFDYVICSHVVEHIPIEELGFFISELQRIAKRGYIEFPTIFYELINYQPVHIWLMNYRSKTMLFLDKKTFSSNYIHLIYRELFYGNDKYMFNAFSKYKELFFFGFEWFNKIDYEIVQDYNELINENDLIEKRDYFKNLPINNIQSANNFMIKKIIKKVIPNVLLNSLRKWNDKKKIKDNISQTAIIEDKELIEISISTEVKDYVIIRTFENKIIIGEYTQINPFTVLYGGSGITIGKNVMIGPNCVLAAGNHDYIQTRIPMRFAGNLSKGPIVIEDDVWIGANCTITDGVIIKQGAVIGANSLICKNVEAFSIVGGVPAKQIGSRPNNKK